MLQVCSGCPLAYMLFFSLYYKYPVNKDSAIWAEFLHSFQLTFMNIKVLNGMSLISWFGSRSNEINILIFPVQTTPRPTYQTVCLPSSQVSQRYPKFSMFKTEPGPSSSILCHSKGLVHTVMQARNPVIPGFSKTEQKRPFQVIFCHICLLFSCFL